MNFTTFQPLVDFSCLEKAIQTTFCSVDGSIFQAPPNDDDATRESWIADAASVAFYTSFQELTFQQCRPRVRLRIPNVNHVRGAYAVDPNGTMREKAWTATAEIGIVTKPDYTYHNHLKSAVLAIIPQVTATISTDNSTFTTTGINDILKYHEVSQFWYTNASLNMMAADNAYMSMIPISLAFNVKTSAWPAGMQQY